MPQVKLTSFFANNLNGLFNFTEATEEKIGHPWNTK